MFNSHSIAEITFIRSRVTALPENSFENTENMVILRFSASEGTLIEKLLLNEQAGADYENKYTLHKMIASKQIVLSLFAEQVKSETLAGVKKYIFSKKANIEYTYAWNSNIGKYEKTGNLKGHLSFHYKKELSEGGTLVDIFLIVNPLNIRQSRLCIEFYKDRYPGRNLLGVIDNETTRDIIGENEIIDIKFYTQTKLLAEPEAVRPVDKPTPKSTPPIIDKYYPVYFGLGLICMNVILFIFKVNIPLFESYSSAFLFSFIVSTIAGFYFYFVDRKYFNAFGIVFSMFGILGIWQKWQFLGEVDVFILPLSIGILLLVIGFIPGLIGLPLLCGGAYYLIVTAYQSYKYGFGYIPFHYWILSIIAILVGKWLLDRQKKIENVDK